MAVVSGRTNSAAIKTLPRSVNNRYILRAELGAGGMGIVYRAMDRLTGQAVAFKQVTTRPRRATSGIQVPDVDYNLALAKEFETLASLRHPNIISVLDYGFDSDQNPFFTMDYLENAQTILEAGRKKSFTERLNLLIQLLQAMAYLHRRGVLHRDLKPANVMVVDGSHVQVLDFGLTTSPGSAIGGFRGTLAYMAPELLDGSPATKASDLFAVGVIAYELLAGRHPFDDSSIPALIQGISNQEVDTSLIHADPRVIEAVQRLMIKNPDDREADAARLVAAYEAATNQKLSYETIATRESFLQSARFVGRDDELKHLQDAVTNTLDGHGSVWLVGGESGVGKSRLLDELRIHTLVRGIPVLRGQAVSTGASSYQLWRDVLRWLCLSDLSDLEAGVLKVIITDLPMLLGRNIPDAPELDPQAAQDRFISTVIGLFRRQHQPLLIILEDLQWAGEENLTLLLRLARIVPERALQIIATYRDDEAPSLPDRLPQAKLLTLNRLSEDHIADLSESMIGPVGRKSSLVGLLRRETEGNAFFLVEVVRALAEEAGQLDKIGEKTLPAQVFTGGIKRIVRHRLEQIPVNARPLLEYAAAYGRKIDPKILQRIDPNTVIEQWLEVCQNAVVLNVQNGQWQFAHDKLREAVLEELEPDRLREIHRRVATVMESVYPADAERVAALAYHYRVAGDAAREIYYSALAGEYAVRNSAYQEGADYLERVLALDAQTAQLTSPVNQRMMWHRLLGEANIGLGRLPESITQLEQSAILVGHTVPKSGFSMALGVTRQALIQITHRFHMPRVVSTKQRDQLLNIIQIYEQLSLGYYWDNRKLPSIYAAITTLNLAEKAGPSPELLRSYAAMCIATSLVPLHKVAKIYSRKVHEIGKQLGDVPSFAAAIRTILLADINAGRWEVARQSVEYAKAIALRFGDYRVLGDIYALSMILGSSQGDMEYSTAARNELLELALRTGNKQHQTWAATHAAQVALSQNRLDDAIRDLSQVGGQGRETQEIATYGMQAVVHLRKGEYRLAYLAAEHLIRQLSGSAPTAFEILDGYAGSAEVYLTLLELGEEGSSLADRKSLLKTADQACKGLAQYARTFALGGPYYCRWKGLHHFLAGNTTAANQLWRKGIAQSEQLGTPYNEALLYYEMGRHMDAKQPERHTNLQRALAIFSDLDSQYYLNQVEKLLNT